MKLLGLRYAFIDANLKRAPDEPGVYALYRDERLIYVGAALGGTDTIRFRLKNHQESREGSCTQEATHYRYQITSNGKLRARDILDQYFRETGRQPRCNRMENAVSTT